MRKIILTVLIMFCSFNIWDRGNIALGSEFDYQQTYLDLQVPTFSYVHNIDPGQFYDNRYSTWSPYPLLRLSSPLYFKTLSIAPGYYDLTPTEYKGQNYILFKQVGLVKFIVPTYKKEFVPEGFYETHLPQPKLSAWERFNKNYIHFVGTHFKSAQRRPIPQGYVEVNDLDNKFVSMVVYYGPYRYYTIFRTVAM